VCQHLALGVVIGGTGRRARHVLIALLSAVTVLLIQVEKSNLCSLIVLPRNLVESW
jgi:hypothetical protein